MTSLVAEILSTVRLKLISQDKSSIPVTRHRHNFFNKTYDYPTGLILISLFKKKKGKETGTSTETRVFIINYCNLEKAAE